MSLRDRFNNYLQRATVKLLNAQGIGTMLPLVEEVSFLYNIVGEHSEPVVFFDVGANIGNYTKAVVEIFPQNTEIHCFEPAEETFRQLSANTADIIANRGRIQLNNVGLSRFETTQTLYYNKKGSGLASLSKRRLDHFNIDFSEQEEIRLTTLEKYCNENNVSKIDVLKLDVEGHELDVLEGARSLFNENKIGLVQFEFGGCNIDSKTYLQDFYYFFKEYGFTLHRMSKNKVLFPIASYKEFYEIPMYQNFVAIKNI